MLTLTASRELWGTKFAQVVDSRVQQYPIAVIAQKHLQLSAGHGLILIYGVNNQTACRGASPTLARVPRVGTNQKGRS